MNHDTEELRRRLPLPEVMARCGDGERAKATARCLLPEKHKHADANPSAGIYQTERGQWRFKCQGCGVNWGEPDYLKWRLGLTTEREAFEKWRELAGVNGTGATGLRPSVAPRKTEAAKAKDEPEKDQGERWREAVAAFSDDHCAKLAAWRGFSVEFVRWLRERESVGLFNGNIAFPVHDEGGRVVGVHYRVKPKSGGERATWLYESGCNARPLVIGDAQAAASVMAFESQWDAFAVMDRLGWHKAAPEAEAVVITRGAGNGKTLAGLCGPDAMVLAFPQNDDAGAKWLRDVSEHAGRKVLAVSIPKAHKDANDWTRAGTTAAEIAKAVGAAAEVASVRHVARVLEFLRPSELRDYRPPEGIVLVGDCHIVRGNVFVIGGPPGIGKSRSGVALAVAGATGADWFGLKVFARFRTMIVQNENGRFRLSREFADLDCAALEDFVRVCPPPPLGLAFDRAEFQETLAAAIADFRPDVIVIDPWNAVARDEKARDYLDTFNAIRAVIPTGDTAPALGIVAHTRKPRSDERATGRSLLNLLSGSYVLGSVPRSAFVMQSASDDPTDNRVVWTCCKNNDGELGDRSAWERRNGLFAFVADFDWTEFDRPANDRATVTETDVAEVFEHGKRSIRKAEAVAALKERTGAGHTACYNALSLKGRFASHLKESEGLLTWKP